MNKWSLMFLFLTKIEKHQIFRALKRQNRTVLVSIEVKVVILFHILLFHVLLFHILFNYL